MLYLIYAVLSPMAIIPLSLYATPQNDYEKMVVFLLLAQIAATITGLCQITWSKQ